MSLKWQIFSFVKLNFLLLTAGGFFISSSIVFEPSAQTTSVTPVEFRLIDLFDVRDEKIIWRDSLKSFADQLELPNVQTLITVGSDTKQRLKPLKLIYLDHSGQRYEITGSTQAEMISQWRYHLSHDHANSVLLAGDELIISNQNRAHIRWKAEALHGGEKLVYLTLLGGSIMPRKIEQSKWGQRLGFGKLKTYLKKKLDLKIQRSEKLRCKNWIASLGSKVASLGPKLPAPLAAVVLDHVSRNPILRYDLESQHRALQQELLLQLNLWNELIQQAPSTERDEQLGVLLSKILAKFDHLKLLAHPDTAEALARFLGRDSETMGVAGSLPVFLNKIQNHMAKDKEVINATESFTKMRDDQLRDQAQKLGLSVSKWKARVEELQNQLNQFSITIPDADLRHYQNLRAHSFNTLKTREQLNHVQDYIVDGEVVYTSEGQRIKIKDYDIRMGLEKRLESAYYLSLFNPEWNELLAKTASEFLTPRSEKGLGYLDPRHRSLSLAEGLAEADQKSSFNTSTPDAAYQNFITAREMSANALDALQAELGFLQSAAQNPQSSFLNQAIAEKIQQTREEYGLAKQKNFEALASAYWQELRKQATDDFYFTIFGGDANTIESLKNSGAMPEEYWNALQDPAKVSSQKVPSHSR